VRLHVLLSCGRQLTFVENLISVKVPYIVSPTAHNPDGQFILQLQLGRPGRDHTIVRISRDESRQCSGEAEQTGRDIWDHTLWGLLWKGGQGLLQNKHLVALMDLYHSFRSTSPSTTTRLLVTCS
jgi:hypothetical protein